MIPRPPIADPPISRRHALLGAATIAATTIAVARPAHATPAEVAQEIARVTEGATPRPGRVKLDLAQMVENGNAVGVILSTDPPPGTTIRSLHLFAEANPNPVALHAQFGPAAYAPRLATRMRLATSQNVTALAVMSDGSCWTDTVTVMVTLAACLE